METWVDIGVYNSRYIRFRSRGPSCTVIACGDVSGVHEHTCTEQRTETTHTNKQTKHSRARGMVDTQKRGFKIRHVHTASLATEVQHARDGYSCKHTGGSQKRGPLFGVPSPHNKDYDILGSRLDWGPTLTATAQCEMQGTYLSPSYGGCNPRVSAVASTNPKPKSMTLTPKP